MRFLLFLWSVFAACAVILTSLCFIFVGDKTFQPTGGEGIFRGVSEPNYGLIFLLSAAINVLLYLGYRLGPESPVLARLRVPHRSFWLSSPERRAILVTRLRRLIAAMASWIDFLVASGLYMTLQYFHRTLPCPRHLLMILIWFLLTVAVGLFGLAQFRIKTALFLQTRSDNQLVP